MVPAQGRGDRRLFEPAGSILISQIELGHDMRHELVSADLPVASVKWRDRNISPPGCLFIPDHWLQKSNPALIHRDHRPSNLHVTADIIAIVVEVRIILVE